MSHVGLITPAYTGHVNPMITLGRELQRRGHRVSVVSTPDARAEVVAGGLEFIAVGIAEFPLGSLEKFTDTQGKLNGIRAMRFILKDLAKQAEVHGRDLPDALRGNGVDALVVDQISTVGASAAELLDLPFVSLCSLLPLNTDLSVPPWTMPWPADESTPSKVRNRIGYQVGYMVQAPLANEANRQRRKWGLNHVDVDETFSELAQIAQVPAAFDFPRKYSPAVLHHTGPLHEDESTGPIPFPWERLDGRPMIYASMGTLQNRSERVFRIIAEACSTLDAQLVITLGHKGARIPTDFPGNPVIVDYAPQLELFKRASLYIGPGGGNTLTQSLEHGVPMVLIPVTFDNPGVAARGKYHGVAEFVPVTKLSVRRLRKAVDMVLSNASYRDNVRRYQDVIRGMDAVSRTADIVEEAFRTRRPVLAAAGGAAKAA